jgi:hypothetical protein
MDNYSIIEGMIRQSTNNPIERDTTDDSLASTPQPEAQKEEPRNAFLFAEGEGLRKEMMKRIYEGAAYHNEDQEFFKKLIDLMHYVDFLEYKLNKIKQEANKCSQHLV